MRKVKLSVNINKLATIRNSRGGNNPDILKYAKLIENYGADGITVHPRPDQRHIRDEDVMKLSKLVRGEFNVEGYPDERFLQLVEKAKPAQVTLVPDPPGVLTSNTGWDTIYNQRFLQEVVKRLHEGGMRVSLFLNPEPGLVESAASTGAERIELYTESFASHYMNSPQDSIQKYKETAIAAEKVGLGINAGHDLSLENLKFFAGNIPGLLEVSIGHALVCDALEYGMQNTVKLYLRQLEA